MQKIYMSRAQTRAMAFDHPIGDATGGPAYGERRDPISATIAVVSMASTYAAAGTIAAMTLTQGLVFAGAAMSLAGNVTGNKKLSKLGMVAGLAGGVGMLAESAMGTTFGSSVGDTFGAGAGDAAAAGASGATAPLSGSTAPVVDGAQTSAVNMGGEITTTSLGPLDSSAAGATQNLNVAGGGTNALNAGPTASGVNAGPTDYSIASATPTAPGAGGVNMGAAGGLKATPGAGTSIAQTSSRPGVVESFKAGNYMDAAGAAGSNVMDLAKTNPGAAQMLGGAVSGGLDMLTGKTDAQLDELEAKTGYYDASAMKIQEEIAREKRRRTQLNANLTNVKTGINLNPNVQIPQPFQPQAGLINGARAPA